MKKNYKMKTGKVLRSCLTALLAVVMAAPVTAISSIGTVVVDKPVEAEAADVELPEPIMSLDFERGFKGEKADGIAVKESKPRLMFEEYTDDAGNYVKENGEYVFKWTDEPVIFGTEDSPSYQYGTFGNQPTTVDDPEKGNVLCLDSSIEVERIIKTKSDKMDKEIPVYTGDFDADGNPTDEEAAAKSTIQEEFTAHSGVQITNPFAGKDFSEEYEKTDEGPVWSKGVTISYWVKVPTVEPAEGEEVDDDEILNDSVLFTFENIQRPEGADESLLDPNGENVVYGVDGWIKYEAAQAYDPADPMYALGTRETYTDMNTGEEFTVAKDYGPLVRLTPEYEGSAEKKIYFRDDESTKTPDKKVTFMENNAQVTAKLYELGANIRKDFVTLDTNEGSLIPRGYINGSMQIAASNTFHFKEDDFAEEVTTDANGNQVRNAVSGATDINPNNKENKGEYKQFRYYNMYYFEGDGRVTSAPDQWHYVTCVIQNDWVQFYVDGVEIESDELGYHGTDFNSENAKKYFNKGFGIRYPYHIGWQNVADWIEDGTFSTGPSNCVPQTMLEWLSNEDTVLYLGYQGMCADELEQDMGTLDNVLLDDVKFYDVPLTSEEATALYEKSLAEKDADTTKAVEPIKVFDFDSDANGAIPANMTSAATNDAEEVAEPSVVNDAKYGHVLKLNASRSQYTSAVQFENPYKGMNNLTGATVSYWVRAAADSKGKISEGVAISFLDEPKVLEHGKIQESVQDLKTRTGLFSELSCDAAFVAGIDTDVYKSLKNTYTQSTIKNAFTDPDEDSYDEESDKLEQEWETRLASMSDWHYVTMVLENSGITMYLDGVKHANNQQDLLGYTFYGPRFYDGYYNKIYDSFSAIRLGTGNQGATSLLEFLTQNDTAGYFGFMYKYGSSATYATTAQTYFDDVSFYDKALSEEEVKAVYDSATSTASSKSAVPGEPVEGTATDDQGPDEPDENSKTEKGGFTETADGKLTASANGVTVTADKSSIPAGAELVVSILGTADAAASYTAANSALKAAGIDVNGQVTTLYDIHLEVNGVVTAPTGPVTVTLTPPSGYQAAKTSIVRMSDVKSMSTSVSGSSLTYETESLGEFAVMQKKGTVSGNVSSTGNSSAGKTGDTVSVVVPVVLLAAAFCVIMVLRRKEELMED